MTLPCLYIYKILLFIYNNNNIHNYDVHTYNTRQNDLIYQPFSRLSVGQNSPSYQGVMFHNKIIKRLNTSSSYRNLKNVAKMYLLENPFYSVKEFLNS